MVIAAYSCTHKHILLPLTVDPHYLREDHDARGVDVHKMVVNDVFDSRASPVARGAESEDGTSEGQT